ncbi:PucR family transcriptional regulator [Mycolicibacterium rufum]|uniref:PucR family transcriptional regulator n=1 Tax=Mycolicibacterium rufum TaxID=318424 RepID=A0A9X2YA30_9MYCO|nr:PucR family transcriptional regulator [Mycolicibacterium rufum]KGI67467.1 PucR family transcriptional regulator [Mycolicibacterium rufum]MCV7070087.1 PucR family transcriptional regulator ligand-binding domain-containing protein [Mycolicibacterium rufum]ULP38419.1 PucR family transcriptional regulator [Mycolicibacterium rufum]
MAITARELARVDGLGLSLIAGAAAADRDITWAHAIELADPTPYLSGGELVMTTGINIGTDERTQFDYVARLAAAGTAALAVDTGTTLTDVPAGVRAAGDRLGLPVLEVPPSTPFIAITRTVIDAVRADELRAVQRVVDGQEVLARATLRGGIPGVVEALAERLAGTVLVVGTDGTVLAAAGAEQDRLSDLLAGDRPPPAARRGGDYVTGDDDAYVTVQNLRAAQPLRGQLAVRTVSPMSNAQRLLVAHAVSLVSIALEKPAGVAEAEQRLRTAVTRGLLGGSGLVDDGVLRYFGFEPHADVVAVMLLDVGPMLAAEQELGRLLAATGPYLMAPLGDEIVIVVPSGERRRIDALTAQWSHPLTGGVSDAVSIDHLGVGLEQARIAGHTDPGRLSAFADLGTLGVLLGGRSSTELDLLAAAVEPLDTELIGTLEAYLRRNGHLEAAATELRIHRHTMRHRMRRIGELLGQDVDAVDTRVRLWLAVRARQLRAERPSSAGPPSGGGLSR